MKKTMALGLMFVFGLASVAIAATKTPEQIYKEADYVVKLIIGSRSSTNWEEENWGSGFIVNLRKYGFCVITASHNFTGTATPYLISAYFKDGTPKQELKLVAESTHYDAVILQFNNPKFVPSKTAIIGNSATLKPGARTLAIGSSGLGDFCFSADGSVLREIGPPSEILKRHFEKILGGGWYRNWPTVVLTNNNVFRGCSGGPLLNEQGEVVGIVVGYFGLDYQIIAVSLPIDELLLPL